MRRGPWGARRASGAVRALRLAAAAPALACAVFASPPAARAAETTTRICDEQVVAMSDGVRLHAWVSRLAPDHPRSVLFMMDSYARGGQPNHSPDYDNACPATIPDDYVPQYLSKDLVDRFTLVQVSYRGTGSSEGLFDLTAPRTQQDVHEALRWAATQPWSTGRIVVSGESGTGFAGYHAISDPHVKAALLMTTCPDMYRCFYRGGQYNSLAEVYLAGTSGGFAAGLDARNRLGLNLNPAPPEQVAAIADMGAQVKAHATDDAFWKERSALENLKSVRVPVMLTSDLYDIVQPFDGLQSLKNVRFNFGGGHLARDSAAAAGGSRYVKLVRTPADRFVAHYGLGEHNGAQRDPRVTLTTNTGSFKDFRAGHLLVRQAARWPLKTTRWTRLYLGDGGTLATKPGAAATDTAPLASAPHADLRTTAFALGDSTPTDFSGDERSGLTYTTPAFKRDLEVTGPIGLKLFASATATDFDWTVRITDVWPDGRSEWITDASLRASLRKVDGTRSLRDPHGRIVRPWLTYDSPQPLTPGEVGEYQLDVIPTSNVFRKGHRIRLDILPQSGGTDAGRTGGAGALMLARGQGNASAITLPVIGARCQHEQPLTAGTARVTCAKSYTRAIR
jgi:uncharacterized protein